MICLVVGGGLCLAYAWLLDDAYVYFKYVDNWVLLGRGLVYNPGEYAEGYTSPAWLLLLAGLRSLGLGYWLVVRGIALLAFGAFWWGCIVVHRALAAGAAPTVNVPLALLCSNYAVLSYFSSGTESPLVQLSAVAYALCLLRPDSRLAQLAVGISPLVRPELGVAWLLAGIWLAWSRRRAPVWLLASGIVAVSAWLVFRVLYYADLFPTTFYLKSGSDPIQGLRYLHDALRPYHLYVWLGLGLAALVAARTARWEPERLTDSRVVMLGIGCAIALYVVSIGGDARHYRYLAFPVCLWLLSFGGLLEQVSKAWHIRLPTAAASVVGLSVALSAVLLHPRQIDRHPLPHLIFPASFPAGEVTFVDKISDAAYHRTNPELVALSPFGSGAAIEMSPHYAAWRRAGGTDPPRRVNTNYLCWMHYRRFDEWSIHAYGLTDPVLARARGRAYPVDRPAHKAALPSLAQDLARIVRSRSTPPQRGMYREAVATGVAPPWVRSNLATLELLERKLYGPRSTWESVELAAHVWERVELDETGEPRD